MKTVVQEMPFVMSIKHVAIKHMFQLFQAYAESEDLELQGLINRVPPPPRTNVYFHHPPQLPANRLQRCLTTGHLPYGKMPAVPSIVVETLLNPPHILPTGVVRPKRHHVRHPASLLIKRGACISMMMIPSPSSSRTIAKSTTFLCDLVSYSSPASLNSSRYTRLSSPNPT